MKVQLSLALLFFGSCFLQAQTVTSFEGMDVSELPKQQLD